MEKANMSAPQEAEDRAREASCREAAHLNQAQNQTRSQLLAVSVRATAASRAGVQCQ